MTSDFYQPGLASIDGPALIERPTGRIVAVTPGEPVTPVG